MEWGARCKKLVKEKQEKARKQREAKQRCKELEEDERERVRRQNEEEERERIRKQNEEEERRRSEAEEAAARAKWVQFHESKTMDEVSRMTGREFEEFLKRLFTRMGYTNISLTPANDQGGDLHCLSPSGIRTVVQAKRWQGSVGNGAVQELLGAMLMYDCTEGIVVTNSSFTGAARDLAGRDSRITLRDGRWLEEQIKSFLPSEIPEFSWDEYNRVVKDYRLGRTSRPRSSRFRRYWSRRRS
jgi:restriction endonuclease Mrr